MLPLFVKCAYCFHGFVVAVLVGPLGFLSERWLLSGALGRVGLGLLVPWSVGPLVPPHNSIIQSKSTCRVLVFALGRVGVFKICD